MSLEKNKKAAEDFEEKSPAANTEASKEVSTSVIDSADTLVAIDIKEAQRVDILGCPFCGNEADTNSDGEGCSGKYYLSCMGFGCEMHGPVKKTMSKAIKAWNTRPASQ